MASLLAELKRRNVYRVAFAYLILAWLVLQITDIVAPTPDGKPRSIAVLPFVNMSNDPEQEYFSDGISEELLNGLARIGELRVALEAFRQINQLQWQQKRLPVYMNLRDNPKFLAVLDQLDAHINAERAKLDWPPAEATPP